METLGRLENLGKPGTSGVAPQTQATADKLDLVCGFCDPYPQRTRISRLLGPKTLLYKAFDAKGEGFRSQSLAEVSGFGLGQVLCVDI